MDCPQRNEAGHPLVIRPDDIERVATDQLQQLDRYRQMIIEIRASITDDEFSIGAMEQHQRAIPAAEPIEKSIQMKERNKAPIHHDQHSRYRSPTPEDIAMQERGQEAIQGNAECLEEVGAEEQQA
ncbi:hypothetical protein V3C99_000553 [Haemonchus contortus]|uniref:Uncharacterized protein n=1 Tax=Haemonchus contortus TaxID=6289 RepID=A0A7I5E9N7_HAECO